jgi:hypothetical protein
LEPNGNRQKNPFSYLIRDSHRMHTRVTHREISSGPGSIGSRLT